MKSLDQVLSASGAPADLQKLILALAQTCAEISAKVRLGALAGVLGEAGSDNVQGEHQKKLDLIANDLLVNHLSSAKVALALGSEEMDHAVVVPGGAPYLVAFDPLDGSSNIDVNVSIGTIFSVLPAPAGKTPGDEDFLQPGERQVAAGYAVYGPSTELVFSLGQGVQAFTLDNQGRWLMTVEKMTIAPAAKEFAINASNSRFWYAPVQRYISELQAGKTGPRGKDFNMRWVASMVADVHRILCRGGVFLYPADQRDPAKPGKLRLLYEANPMSFLVEQAGGVSTNGHERILSLQPTKLHERVAVFLGAKEEIDLVTGYHR